MTIKYCSVRRCLTNDYTQALNCANDDFYGIFNKRYLKQGNMMQIEILKDFAEQYNFDIKEYDNTDSYLEESSNDDRLKPNTLGLLPEESGSKIEGLIISLGNWNGNELWEILEVNNIMPQYMAVATDAVDIIAKINDGWEKLTA